jgi:hypothetical protein
MTTTYSTDLRIALIGTGDQDGTWGTTTNTNLGTLLEQAIAGVASISISSANQALAAYNGLSDEARNAVLVLTSSGAANVYVPPVDKVYIVKNAGSYAITLYCSTVLGNTTPAGTGITVPAGKSMVVYSDATNIVEGIDRINGNLTVGGTLGVTGNITATANLSANNIAISNALPVTSGGTGLATLTANAVVLGNGTSNPSFVSPGTSGNVLVSNGTTWTSGVAFVTGMIMLWSGSVGSIPSGWLLCDGTNSTPDLRNRFVVGAGDTYSVNATGGSTTTTATGSVSGTVAGTALTEAQMPKHYHRYITGQLDGGTYPNNPSYQRNANFFGGTPDDGAYEYSTYSTGGNAASGDAATGTANGDSHTHGFSATFTGNAVTSLPPYYALCYIMKA